MDSLCRYIAEAKRQAELLQRASESDSLCSSPKPPEIGGSRRRRWTRQDGNRFWHESAVETAIAGYDSEAIDAVFVRACHTRMRRRVDRSKHRTTKDLFQDWAKGVLNRKRPPMIEVAEPGTALADFPVGKGMVTMIGAPPSAGKTALVCQLVFDALAMDGQEELRALIANCEMPPSAIFDRELSRVTGIGTSHIAKRTYDPDATPRLQAGIDQLEGLIKRVEFMRFPFELERLAADAAYHEADIVVLDYLQRFAPKNSTTDQRTKVNKAMDCCRRLASEGRAVIAISAINRPQSKNGKYEISGMGLSSFRESSEIEYGADCCYLLLRPDDESTETILKCVKNRNGERRDIHLEFHGSRMQFVDKPLGREWIP